MNIPIRNKSRDTLRVMIEPSAQSYDVQSGEEIVVCVADSSFQGFEVEAWDDNFIALWIASEVSVSLAGEKLEPLKDA